MIRTIEKMSDKALKEEVDKSCELFFECMKINNLNPIISLLACMELIVSYAEATSIPKEEVILAINKIFEMAEEEND